MESALPRLLDDTTYALFGAVRVSSLQLLITGIAIALMVALDFVVRKTAFGMAMRAIACDRATVPLMGVPVNRVISITFGIGAALVCGPLTLVLSESMWAAPFIAALAAGIGGVASEVARRRDAARDLGVERGVVAAVEGEMGRAILGLVADDVVDLSLRVAMGALCTLTGAADALQVGCKPSDAPVGGAALTDGVRKTAADYQATFPYLKAPLSGSFNN